MENKKQKLPKTIFLIKDVFINIVDPVYKNVGFRYSEKEAEDICIKHGEEMQKGYAMFLYYDNKLVTETDPEKAEKMSKEMSEYDKYDGYHTTIVEEIKLMK